MKTTKRMPEVVIKKDGTKEPYQKEKVIQTLKRINASDKTINFVLHQIDKDLPSKITTKELYQFIFNLLRQKEYPVSVKYRLRSALALLGPSGYPFEKFFSHLLNFYGYQTETNIFLTGKCLTYEIDILAKKENLNYIIECKFHQKEWFKNDAKTILYSYARFIDIKNKNQDFHLWLATNTKFTKEVISFAQCYEIKLTSWNYPPEENLAQLIENKKLYPVTILTCCPHKVFQSLIKFEIVLIQDLLKKEKKFIQKITHLSEKEVEQIFNEAKLLLGC